jgi:hypothetical protein
MPQCAGEGSGARQKPKTNLETDEFASNPPFSKKSSRRFHFAAYFLAGKIEVFKNYFKML